MKCTQIGPQEELIHIFESLLGALINKGGCVHRFDVEFGVYNPHFKKKSSL
jgi:hypothetical protein